MSFFLHLVLSVVMTHRICHGSDFFAGPLWPGFSSNGTGLNRAKRDGFPDHGAMTAPEIIQDRGYQAEVHKVVTKDGYILEMHRIPGPHPYLRKKGYNLPGGGRPVYIQHCVLCSSGDFVLNDPHQALSFVLADAGFDVWLGNYRGNTYSREHRHLSPEETPYWKFSFMEMAHYDIPTMIYYILEKTGHSKISYIGHSMGTTGLFAANSLMPELNYKVRVMVAMAPVAYFDHIKGPMRHIFQYAKYSHRFHEKLNKAESYPKTKTQATLAKAFCSSGSIFMPFCQAWLPALSGVNRGYVNPEYLHVVLSHIPAGTSARTLAHLGQLVDSGAFQMFDMGPRGNLLHYGTTDVPNFELRKTLIPVGLFWSDNDWVSTPRDVARIARELPNVTLNYRVPQSDFNHMDFLFSETAKQVLYDQVTRFLLAH